MGTASVIYRIVLVLHIIAAIVGFGGLVANGINNAKAYRSPVGQARTLLTAGRAVAKIAEYGLYAVLALGIVLVAISDSAFSFGAPWVSAAFVVWFAIIGLSHGLVRPAVVGLIGRTETLAAEAPGQAMPILESDEQAGQLAKRLAIGEGLIQLLLLVAVALMVWQPGN